jgi:hypothetical protein
MPSSPNVFGEDKDDGSSCDEQRKNGDDCLCRERHFGTTNADGGERIGPPFSALASLRRIVQTCRSKYILCSRFWPYLT